MKLNIFGAVQKGVGAIKFIQKALRAIDKIDDDLDGNGKSELQDICEQVEHLIKDVVFQAQALLRDAISIVNIVKLQGAGIVSQAHKLFDHVLSKEDAK